MFFVFFLKITKNAWQSTACSPLGIAVTPSSRRKGEVKLSSDRHRERSTDPRCLAVKRTYSQTADRRGVYSFHPLKLWSYWTEVHQIFTRCSQIIVDEPCKIRSALLLSVSEWRAMLSPFTDNWQRPLSDWTKKVTSLIHHQIPTTK